MKKVTTQIVYKPRSAVPQSPTFKAVLIDTEKFILDSYKAYTYAPADFSVDDTYTPSPAGFSPSNETVLLYDGIKADMTDPSVMEVTGRVKAGDTPVDIMTNGLINNIGIVAEGTTLKLYEWAIGLPVLAGPIEVVASETDGAITIPGASSAKTYYVAYFDRTDWIMGKLEHKAPGETTFVAPATDLPLGIYTAGDIMVYEDIYGLTGEVDPDPVSIYLTINEESTSTDYRCKLTEITNSSVISDMYGDAAMDTPGNIAYSASLFLDDSGGLKTFYVAPITSADEIGDLIEELQTHDDAYYLIYNVGDYSTNKADADALIAHAKMASSPLYKKERRVYVREPMDGITAHAVAIEAAAAINSALGIDNERVTLVMDYVDTDSFLKYCAKRYSVSRDYSLTHERIDIGNIWEQASNLSDATKQEMRDNGVVVFDQETPTSIPKVMFQTTTSIEQSILAKKEENIQIAIDELCWSIRKQTLPRIAKGMNNKVTADPNSKTSRAYIKNLNADIASIRREYSGTFADISIMGIEIDEADPRHVRMHILAVPYYNVNRIDVYIYVV